MARLVCLPVDCAEYGILSRFTRSEQASSTGATFSVALLPCHKVPYAIELGIVL